MDRKIPPKHILRGYSLEYLIALYLPELSSSAYISNQKTQEALTSGRKAHYEDLKQAYPGDAVKIEQMARKVVGNLPKADGEIRFVEVAANGSDVFDVIYRSVEGELIKLSAKTSKTEDKSYRFNTSDYLFDDITAYLSTIFTSHDMEQGFSYADVLQREGLTVRNVQAHIVKTLGEAARRGEGQTYDMLMKLISEKFIGSGGYYKNLPNGSVLYYPQQFFGRDKVSILADSVSTTPTSVKMKISLNDENDILKQLYDLTFRVKFKDGVKKPVKVNQTGIVGNIGATIRLVMIERKP